MLHHHLQVEDMLRRSFAEFYCCFHRQAAYSTQPCVLSHSTLHHHLQVEDMLRRSFAEFQAQVIHMSLLHG